MLSLPILGQNCSMQQTFTWEGANRGPKAVWNIDDTLNTYTNIFGIDVQLKLIDPFKQNTTTENPSIFNDYTQTNTFYGKGSFAFQITAEKPRQDVCLEFSFSKPIVLQDFCIWDIDYIADLRHSSGNFQDYIHISAKRNEDTIALSLSPKSNAPNFDIDGQTIISHYNVGQRNELHHNDPDGAVIVSSIDYITKLTLCYSNGPADNGPSNGQAMRISEFSFCQKLGTLMGFTLEDNTKNPIPNVHIKLEKSDGTAALNFDNQPFEAFSDVNGYYQIEGVPLGNYRVVQYTPEGFKYMYNMLREIVEYNITDVSYDAPMKEHLNFYYRPESPLSVRLTDWGIKDTGHKAHIYWQTLSEYQSDFFKISISRDGKIFTPHSEIKAQGISNSLTSYNHIIDHPFSKNYFIKLTQTDFDGTLFDYGIKKVSLNDLDEWAIFPNPARDLLNIRTQQEIEQDLKVTIVDVLGKQWVSQLVSHKEASFNIHHLPVGTYWVTIIYDRTTYQSKFIKY